MGLIKITMNTKPSECHGVGRRPGGRSPRRASKYGKMITMPTLPAWPDDAKPSEEVEAAIAVMGNRTNVQILQFLAPLTNATHGMILRGTGLSKQNVSRHLKELEDYSVLRGDIPRDERRGAVVNYSLVRERLEVLQSAWMEYVLGQS